MKRPVLMMSVWLLALALVVLLWKKAPRETLPPSLWKVPAFEVMSVTTRGPSRLRRDDLLGHPWIADFIYTTCGGPCPMMSAKMAVLQRVLPKEVKLVSFTVDPEHDTPAVLQAYAERFHADPDRWLFAREKKDALYALEYQGFHIDVAENRQAPPGSRVQHSTEFLLVDSSGNVRGLYNGNSETFMEGLRHDVAQLLTPGE